MGKVDRIIILRRPLARKLNRTVTNLNKADQLGMLHRRSIRSIEVLLTIADQSPIGSLLEPQLKDQVETTILLLPLLTAIRLLDRTHRELVLLVHQRIDQATVGLLTVDLHTTDQVEVIVTAGRMCDHRAVHRFNLNAVSLHLLHTTTPLLTVLRAEEAVEAEEEVLQVVLLDHPGDNIKTKENEKIHLNI